MELRMALSRQYYAIQKIDDAQAPEDLLDLSLSTFLMILHDVSYEAFEEDVITEEVDDEYVPGMMTTRTENRRRANKRTISSTSTTKETQT